jgi:hypothetical protein
MGPLSANFRDFRSLSLFVVVICAALSCGGCKGLRIAPERKHAMSVKADGVMYGDRAPRRTKEEAIAVAVRHATVFGLGPDGVEAMGASFEVARRRWVVKFKDRRRNQPAAFVVWVDDGSGTSLLLMY